MVDEMEDFPEREEFHLIDYVNIVLKRRWMIVIGVFLCVLFVGIRLKMQSPVYTASAKFLPSRNPEMTSRMGTLIGTSGRIESLENNVTSEYYTELLKSSPFLERISNKKFFSKELGQEVDLISYYEVEADNEVEKSAIIIEIIDGSLEISTARTTNVISLSYSTNEAELSAAIVNAFLEELIIYNQDVKESRAQKNREFIETQLNENRKLLKDAEAELADFTAKNRIIGTPVLEVELERLKRNVKVQEEVYLTLRKQLELAKIEEQEKKPVIEIIERAAPPLHRSSPKIRRGVMLAGFVSLFLFVGLAFAIEYISKINPEGEGFKEFSKNLNSIKNDFRFFTKIVKKKKKD